jgi:hypothetical protein
MDCKSKKGSSSLFLFLKNWRDERCGSLVKAGGI